MQTLFNSFNQLEPPVLILCTPNRDELYTLPLAYSIKNILRYNALSELSFIYPESKDGSSTADPAYAYIQGKMIVYIPDNGYYIIQSCPEDNTGAVPVKAVLCYSLESEFMSFRIVGLEGTYEFTSLLQKIVDYKPTWSVDTVDASLVGLYRTFPKANTTGYNFMTVDMEKAYGCVFEFDTVNRQVSAIQNTVPLTARTNIYLSFDNLAKKVEFKEITEEICTGMYCYGGGDLDVHNVNPLGTNVIYDFSYFKTSQWMSQTLIDLLTAWEAKVAGYQASYAEKLTELYSLNLQRLDIETARIDMIGQLKSAMGVRDVILQQDPPGNTSAIDAEIATLKRSIKSNEIEIQSFQDGINDVNIELRKIVHELYFSSEISYNNMQIDTEYIKNAVADIASNWTETYNSTVDYPDFSMGALTAATPGIISLAESASITAIAIYNTLSGKFPSYPPEEVYITALTGYINSLLDDLGQLNVILEALIPLTDINTTLYNILAMLTSYLDIICYTGNMTTAQYKELLPYIYENTYTNDNIIQTDLMTPGEIQIQSQTLYDQAVTVLEKVSQPRYEFSGEFSNFTALSGFSSFTTDLELGKVINIQKNDETVIYAVLLELNISYDNPTDFEMTFGNRFRLDKAGFIYTDILGDAAKLGASSSGAITQGNIGGWGVGANGLTIPNAIIGSGGYVSFGDDPPTDYGNYQGTWIGYNGAPRLSLFKNVNNFLQWDGSKLLIRAENFTLDNLGRITADSVNLAGRITATSGAIGGWIIDSTSIYSEQAGNKRVILDSTGRYISFGATPPTSYGDNVGAWLGYDTVAKLSLYTDSDNYLQWDGAKLVLKGTNFELDTSSGGTIAGWTIASGSLTSGTGATTVGIDSGGTNPSFYAGSATPATAPFRVYNDGSVWLEDAHIYGDMESVPFLSGAYGWKIERDGHAEFLNISLRGNIDSVVFSKTQINAIAGDIYVTDGAVLVYDISDVETTLVFDTNSFYKGDVIRVSTGVYQEWLTVTTDGLQIASNEYEYEVVRDIAGGGTGAVYAGTVYVRQGSSTLFDAECVAIAECTSTTNASFGSLLFGASPVIGLGGFLQLNGTGGEAPYFGVWRRTGSTYSDLENIARFGNLNGFLGYSDEIYGIGIGEATRHLIYTYADGLEIMTAGGGTTINEDGIASTALIASLNRILTENLVVADTKCFIVSNYLDADAFTITLNGDAVLEII